MPTVTYAFTARDPAGHTTTVTHAVEVSGTAPTGLPGQVAGKVVMGMATDDYNARVAETGPVGADHFFMPNWDVPGFIGKASQARSRGLLPYGNMKLRGSWADYASGRYDADVEAFAQALAQFGSPVRVTLHHEPGFKTPDGAGEGGTGYEWRAMSMRCYPRIKATAPNAVTGVCDNGFKFSPNTSGQGWTDAELDQLYTDEFLACMDALGADYYDGATSRTSGEPAARKVERANAWGARRGVEHMDIGEWNFVRPADCAAMWAVLKANADRWWCAVVFNSDNNNRSQIPTIGGGWNLTHGYDSSGDRLAAFRAVLADPVSHP